MKLDVIVTAHNNEADIKRCLKSILNQSYKNFDLHVICDKCTDKTVEIVKKTAPNADINLTYYGCAGLPRNEGLDRSKNEYVLFCDGDDYYLHSEVFRMLNDLIEFQKEKGTGVDIVFFGFVWAKYGYKDATGNNGNWYPAVWAKLFKRSLIGNKRFTDLQTAEDVEFMNQIFGEEGDKMTFINWDAPMYYYNNPRKGSITDGLDKKSDTSGS